MTSGSSKDHPFIRELGPDSPFRHFAPLAPECKVVQFTRQLNDRQYEQAAELLSQRPDVKLRAYGDYGTEFRDLEFLRFFPSVRSVQIDLPHLLNHGGLRHLSSELERFSWGFSAHRRVQQRPQERSSSTDVSLSCQAGSEFPVR